MIGSATWTGTLSPVGALRVSSQSYNFTPLSATGSISLSNEFQGMAGTNMQVNGYFYGPVANELGATFSGYVGVDPAGSGEGIAGSGVIVGTLK